MERGTTRRSRAGWNGRWSGTTSDYDILKVAFYINDFGGLLRGTGTLAKVRVCLPEVRAIQLGNLPSSTASEGHLDRALKDILTDRLRITESSISTMNLQICQLESWHSFRFRLA